MRSTIKLLSICFVTLALVGCGLKGPLYNPVEKAAMQQTKLTTASIQSDLFKLHNGIK
ncbi:LPS translocon maturation chaperone LptM [Gilliamella sp. Choc5-1]|uniref:LPS translocon maturation chaperone LptM n=1 Tax=Gilliamella sp. Choc5-1 TaxID=3120238 RepID=UPI00159EC0EC|nr:lipoprotein [Gilliamella apicola]